MEEFLRRPEKIRRIKKTEGNSSLIIFKFYFLTIILFNDMISVKKWLHIQEIQFAYEHLTEDEIKLLKHISAIRKRFLVQVIIGFIIISFLMFRYFIKDTGDGEFMNDLENTFRRTSVYFIVYYTLLAVLAYALYHKKIYRYIKDMRSGKKIIFYSEIKLKQYFPSTQQYYIYTESSPFNQFEVSAEEYHYYKTGDFYKVRVSQYGEYIFNSMRKYTLI